MYHSPKADGTSGPNSMYGLLFILMNFVARLWGVICSRQALVWCGQMITGRTGGIQLREFRSRRMFQPWAGKQLLNSTLYTDVTSLGEMPLQFRWWYRIDPQGKAVRHARPRG